MTCHFNHNIEGSVVELLPGHSLILQTLKVELCICVMEEEDYVSVGTQQTFSPEPLSSMSQPLHCVPLKSKVVYLQIALKTSEPKLMEIPQLVFAQHAVSATLCESSRRVCSSKTGSPQPFCQPCPTRQTACQQPALVPHLGKLFPVSPQLSLSSPTLPKHPQTNVSSLGPD